MARPYDRQRGVGQGHLSAGRGWRTVWCGAGTPHCWLGRMAARRVGHFAASQGWRTVWCGAGTLVAGQGGWLTVVWDMDILLLAREGEQCGLGQGHLAAGQVGPLTVEWDRTPWCWPGMENSVVWGRDTYFCQEMTLEALRRGGRGHNCSGVSWGTRVAGHPPY